MPNPIKYSTEAVTKALKKGNFYLGTNDVKKSQTSSTGFWTGYNVPSGGYVVYLNKASNGPSIYVPANNTALVSLTNLIAGTSYTTAAECFLYFSTQTDKMVVDKYYPTLITDQLALDLDAGFIPSYPRSDTKWFDLGPNVRTSDLYNGPTFNAAGYLVFDGTDDEAYIGGNIMTSNSGTVVIWMATTDTQFVLIKGNTLGYYLGAYNGATWYDSNAGSPSYYVDTNTSNDPFTEGYLDGRFRMFEAKEVDMSVWVAHSFFYYTSGSGFNMYTSVARVMIYDKSLSETESLQNFYQGNIVMTNIAGMYDAGNIVSYIPNNTSVYYMSGEIGQLDGSLQNGVGFETGFGGYWRFDGANDRLLLNGSTTNAWNLAANTNWTVNAWIRTTTAVGNTLGAGPIFSNSSGGPVYSVMCVNSGKATYWHYNGTWLQKKGTITVNDGTWHLITWVNRSNSTMDIYVDNVKDVNNVSSALSSSNWLDIIGASWAYTYAGDIASLQINSTAFTSDQVAQNFKETRKKFGVNPAESSFSGTWSDSTNWDDSLTWNDN